MRIAVLGAGGHARVILALVRAVGSHEIAGLLDDDPSKWGSQVDGVSVGGPIATIADLPHDVVVVAVGDNHQRRLIVERSDVEWATLVHPHTWVEPGVELGEGTVVFAGAIVQPGSRIGAHVILNTGAIVDHDCEIGAYAHLAPGAAIAGSVTLGEGALLGIGAAAVPSATVGSWTRVGAGAVVVTDLPSGVDAVGTPARITGGR